jgi:hypothetical protein
MSNIPLLSLPTELLLEIIGNQEFASEVNTGVKTCRRLRDVANYLLYRYFAKRYSPRGLENVIEAGNVTAMNALVLSGAKRRDGSSNPIQMAAARGNPEMVRLLVQFCSLSPIEDKCCLELSRSGVALDDRSLRTRLQ